jgi:hypothetical protein
MSRRQNQVFVAQQLDLKIALHGVGFKNIFLLFLSFFFSIFFILSLKHKQTID